MEFVENYFNEEELGFFHALDFLDNLNYDSDHYWYSGSDDYFDGSDSFDSVDWNNSEWSSNDKIRVLGNILNDELHTWKYQHYDAENSFFPITLGKDDDELAESFPVLPSLMDLSAQVVSKHIPYSYVQRMHTEIPERVAKKIMLWSFPRHITDIYRYWLNPMVLFGGITDPQLKCSCSVDGIDQFGFCIQGQVTFLDETHTASLICDRCAITTASCSCKEESILWCRHIVAIALCRIQHATTVKVHLPIFGSISQLNRDQLQKLLQYLTCDTQLPVLKSLQHEMSRITMNRSLIQEIEDFTAPVIYEGKPKWFLEPFKCKDIPFPFFMLLLRKALKMCKARDANGMLILKNLLLNVPAQIYTSFGPLDKIVIALISVTSSPILSDEEKKECCAILKDDHSIEKKTEYCATAELYNDFSSDSAASVCRNNIHYISCKRTKLSSAAEEARKSIFYLPLAAAELRWDDKCLRRILGTNLTSPFSDFDFKDHYWFEHFPTSCARIDILYNNGYETESIRLAVVIAKSIILQVRRWKQAWINALHDESLSQTKRKVQQLMSSAGESWLNQTMILHKIDPAAILFSSLVNASQILKSISKDNPVIDGNEYIQLAIEALLVILSQQLFPKNMSDQYLLNEFYQTETIWLRNILAIVLPNHTSDEDETEALIGIKWKPDAKRIRDLFKLLADAGPFTTFGSAGDYFIPRYQWGYLMVAILCHIDKNLAVEVGWKCLKYPLNKAVMAVNSNYEEEYTSDHIKLVTFLLSLHNEDSEAVEKILDTADYMKNACKAMLFIKEFKAFIQQQTAAFPEITNFTKNMVLKRLLKILKSEKKTDVKNSGLCLTSLLGFAATTGYDNIIEILTNWNDFFYISQIIEIIEHCGWIENICDLHHKNQTPLANAIYSLILQCIKSETIEDYLIFNALLSALRNFQFTVLQKKVLNDKIFALGISCSAVGTSQDVLYTTLSRLVDDDVKHAAFTNFVSEAIKKHKITPHKLFFYSQQEREENKSSAFTLGTLAVQHILILPNCQYGGIKVNFETNCISSVFQLAIDLGESKITEIVSLVINNVKHDAVLCDLTQTFHSIVVKENTRKPEWLENFIIDVMDILQQSLFRRIKKLRNEVNFSNHLKRTKHIYLLANDGWSHFLSLISHLKPLLPQSKRKFILKSVGL